MYKRIVYGGLLLFLFLVLLGFFNLKKAYKFLPGSTSGILTFPQFAGWIPYSPPTQQFTVDLPLVPQYAQQTVQSPNSNGTQTYDMYVSQTHNQEIYLITLITFSTEIANQPLTLRSIVDEIFNKDHNNRLISFSNTPFQNNTGVEFHFEATSNQTQGIAFILNQRVYLLAYISEKGNFRQDNYQHFISSFKLNEL